ncbi:hypothetical protein GCQ56_02340 [Marinifilum sp. N1E240]|uniref:hypothetical protein n=1 Tax=Marinifilum sp. N1E240 TaxID=2608082 RepID=UPI00128AFB87|nr:hypothetical protein [Marinifilum sp. N1E240]MPQ45836.1 hypothetical protein [Marinifilum sp. N1E240]
MKFAIRLLGVLIFLLGILLLVQPEIIFAWMEDHQESSWLYVSAIVVRIVFGVLLIIAAKASKHPLVVKGFAYLAIIAALIFLFIGKESFQEFLSSIIPHLKSYDIMIGVIAMLLGCFLFYTFSGNRNLKNK